jgi:hypothetical protein
MSCLVTATEIFVFVIHVQEEQMYFYPLLTHGDHK